MKILFVVLFFGTFCLQAAQPKSPNIHDISIHEAHIRIMRRFRDAGQKNVVWNRLKTCEVVARGLMLGTGVAHYRYAPIGVKGAVVTLFATGAIWCLARNSLLQWEYDYKAAALTQSPPPLSMLASPQTISLENKGDPTPDEISAAQTASYKGIAANTMLTLATATIPVLATYRYVHGSFSL